MHCTSIKLILVVLLQGVSCSTISSTTNSTISVPQCCDDLLANLGTDILTPNSTLYTASINDYWANQEVENRPLCVVAARTTKDVSTAIRTLTGHSSPDDHSRCPFAIKAGGHGKWSASSFAGGIVIDLSALNTVALSTDGLEASVGAGAKWRDVYAALDPRNLTVAGTRSADVGVGGSSLAGGLSYFNPRTGLTTDTILDVEVVLASGEIVHTSSEQYRDLDKAIRGGTNNFGVATSFTFRTIPFSGAYGGTIYYPLSTANAQLRTIHDFAADPHYDPYATAILSFGVESAGGAAVVNMAYTSPVASVPEKLLPFTNISSFYDTLRPVNMLNITEETAAASPDGFRQATYTLTLGNDIPTLLAAYTFWNDSYQSLLSVPGITYSFSLEPLPVAALSKTANSITGLSRDASSPLHIYLLSATWSNAADDELVLSSASRLLANVRSNAERLGTLHPFLYAGYADRSQSVFANNASVDYEFARRTSRRVDPGQVFQKQVTGGFKLLPPNAWSA